MICSCPVAPAPLGISPTILFPEPFVTHTPHSYGGFTDVYKCEYRGREVAVKVLKVRSNADSRKITHVSYCRRSVLLHALVYSQWPIQRFCKEAVVWKFLQHPDVLPLLGVLKDWLQFKFAMVSEWQENGNINGLVKACRRANRLRLVSFPRTPVIHHS